MVDILGLMAGRVVGKTTDDIKREGASQIKGGLMGAIGSLTNGVLGTPQQGQQQQGVDQNGIRRLPEVAAGAQGPQVNRATQGLINQFGGGQPQPAQTGQSALGGFLGKMGDFISGRVLPSEDTVNRLKGGAAAVSGGVAGIASGATTLVRDGVETVKQRGQTASQLAPVEDRSTYSAGAIAEAKAAGRDTSRMVQTPEPAQPAAPAQPVASAEPPAKISQLQEPEAVASIKRDAVALGPMKPFDLSPLVTTPILPTVAFAAAAAPVAVAPAPTVPEVQAPAAAATGGRFSADTYERAAAYVAASKPSGPGAGP